MTTDEIPPHLTDAERGRWWACTATETTSDVLVRRNDLRTISNLRALLADEHAKRCAAELDHAGAVAERDAILADFSRELDEARKQITDSVMEWARKSGCIYCGEVFDTLGPEGAGDARRALYVAHTKVCIKHPMRHAEARAEKAEAACAELRAALECAVDDLDGCLHGYDDNGRMDRQDEAGAEETLSDLRALLSRTDLGRGMVAVPRETLERARDAHLSAIAALMALGLYDGVVINQLRASIADLDALLKKGGG